MDVGLIPLRRVGDYFQCSTPVRSRGKEDVWISSGRSGLREKVQTSTYHMGTKTETRLQNYKALYVYTFE